MIIDYVDSIELSDEELHVHANELHSLDYLAQGLHYLYRQVKLVEDKVLEQLNPNLKVFSFGNDPALKWVPRGLVACTFHWYSVSACNYARMVGWLANGRDAKKAKDYVQRVLPSVYLWRNKIGAHFAIADPGKDDTPAQLAVSVMFPIAFSDNAFWASPFAVTMTQNGEPSHSGPDMRWSLTQTHLALCRRFWPKLIEESSDI